MVRKCRKKNDDILFIDASQHFEKVKTTNVIRPEHISKIVQAYKLRKVEDKYSSLVNIEQIKENDWNLNIPRYVNIFEVEEEIDLKVISSELIQLDKESDELNKGIAICCKELGIESPFSIAKKS